MVKRLLFDKYHVSNHGLNWGAKGEFSIRCNPPKKQEKPFLMVDKPWEVRGLGWCTLRIENGKYRVWYEAWAADAKGDMCGRLCYAESDDLVNWVKPELGICEFEGSTKNNILIDRNVTCGLGIHGHSIFVDPNSPDYAKYRCVFLGEMPRLRDVEMPTMSYAYSADGIHWTLGAPELPRDFNHFPRLYFGSDTQCVVNWDKELRRYVGYFRTWEPNGSRSIARSETNNLTEWPMPKTILKPDFLDDFQADYYNSAATKVVEDGDVAHYIFYSWFDHCTDCLEVRLATSRDGIYYDRYDRSAYIKNDSYFDKGGIYVAPGIHDLGNDVQAMIYNGVARTHEESWQTNNVGGTCMVTFPKDRIQGLDTKTKFEFCVMGKVDPLNPEVTLNAEIRGQVKAALIGPDGQFIPGYTVDDCVPVTGDSLRHKITWKGAPTDIRKADLKIFAEDATLYAVTVNEA